MVKTTPIFQVAYTFDAGANACIYLLESEVEDFLSVVNYVFPLNTENFVEYIKGISILPKPISEVLSKAIFNISNNYF